MPTTQSAVPETRVDEVMVQLHDLYVRKNATAAWEREKDKLRNVIGGIIFDIEIPDLYRIVEPIDLGGAGVILKIQDQKAPDDIPVYRALKMPRPIEGIFTSIKNEASALLNVRHSNIIPVHYVSQTTVGAECYSFFVMDYVDNGQDMLKYVRRSLDGLTEERHRWHEETNIETRKEIEKQTNKQMEDLIQWLAASVMNIASALAYLHSRHIIHFDIKPANILVSAEGKVLLADLGYAKSKDTRPTEEVTIGFTEAYAHSDLARGRFRSTGDRSGNRCKKILTPADFKEAWDIFALGKSILHLLNLFDQRNRTIVSLSPYLNYCHLAACRMLDGSNRTTRESRAHREEVSYYEEWRGLTANDFQREELKYHTAAEILDDFNKISGEFRLEDAIPELSSTNRSRIQTTFDYPSVFTSRVQAIVNHPVFSRLRDIPQLGLVNYVYPTATHTRFEHSLGVYSYVCEYVKSLWYDEENPLFRQWISARDIRAVLVSALLHDIGHFPLCHDIEDAPNAENGMYFDHIQICSRFLSSSIRDACGRTISDILRDERDGWGVDPRFVHEIIQATKKITSDIFDTAIPARAKFLANILSGNLDADKLDYLIRDSQACKLKYGESIEINRLFRTLTTSVRSLPDPNYPEDPERQLRTIEIAIYEKGKSAAESIGFARYLMFQSVYSHHASRSLRVMLEAAASRIFSGTRRTISTTLADFDRLLGLNGSTTNLNITVDDVLFFIASHGDDISKEIVELLKGRRIYKRIITVHRTIIPDSRRALDDLYSRIHRAGAGLATRFRSELSESFQRNRGTNLRSINAPSDSDAAAVASLLEKEHSILIDIPKEKYGSPMDLCIIPELEGLKRNDDAKMHASQIMLQVWKDVYGGLMDSISKIRIYCHPDIRDTITSVLGYEELNEALLRALGTRPSTPRAAETAVRSEN